MSWHKGWGWGPRHTRHSGQWSGLRYSLGCRALCLMDALRMFGCRSERGQTTLLRPGPEHLLMLGHNGSSDGPWPKWEPRTEEGRWELQGGAMCAYVRTYVVTPQGAVRH